MPRQTEVGANPLSFESIVDYIVRHYGQEPEFQRLACCKRFEEALGYNAASKLLAAANSKRLSDG